MPTLADYGFRSVSIEVNNVCNMACEYCPYPLRKAEKQSLTPEEIRGVLDELSGELKAETVMFHMFNEPLIYPHIYECIDMANERGLPVLLATNGLTMTPRTAEKLLAHPPRELRISLQVLQEDLHRDVRHIDIDFATYRGNIAKSLALFLDRENDLQLIQVDVAVRRRNRGLRNRLLAAAGIKDAGEPSIREQTPESLREPMAAFLREVEAASSSFRFDQDQLDRNISAWFASEATINDRAYELSDKVRIVFKQFINGRRTSSYFPVRRGQCGTYILGIHADGGVAPCCWDCDGEIKLGNVKKEPLAKTLARWKPFLDRLRQGGPLKFELCRRCLGAPTRHGAWIKDAVMVLRHGLR